MTTKALSDAERIARDPGVRKAFGRMAALGKVSAGYAPDGTPTITIDMNKKPKEEAMTTATQEAPQKLEGLTLDQIRDGSAITLFDETLQSVIANILDERTDPKKGRAVVLTVELFPFYDPETGVSNRRSVDVNIKCGAKLVPIESGGSSHSIQKIGGRNQLALRL